MNKKFLILLAFASLVIQGRSQKKLLDYSSVNAWPSIGDGTLTNNAKFVKYFISVPDSGSTFFVQATDHSWKIKLTGVKRNLFTYDGGWLVFISNGDSLGYLELGT